jgi:DNA invertase Pin-like site-specific DNA recombinase
MTIRGYARVSTTDQNLSLQVNALIAAGCLVTDIYTDRTSGAGPLSDRPAFAQLLAALQPGDTLAVWRLDRITRGLRCLLEFIPQLEARGVELLSITERIDFASAAGQLMIGIMGSLAQYERDQLRERVNAGVAAAKRNGVAIGRPRALAPVQLAGVRQAYADGASLRSLAAAYRVSRETIRLVIGRLYPYED